MSINESLIFKPTNELPKDPAPSFVLAIHVKPAAIKKRIDIEYILKPDKVTILRKISVQLHEI